MVLHRMHSPTKKEKRSKKERKAATTTEPHFSVNFGLVSTYKGLGGVGVKQGPRSDSNTPHVQQADLRVRISSGERAAR